MTLSSYVEEAVSRKLTVCFTSITDHGHTHRLILSAIILLWSPLTALAQESFPTIDAFLRVTLKGEDQLSAKAEGDLTDDGLADWVGVIHGRDPDAAPTYQLYVLLQVPPSGYRIAERTQEAEIPGMGCCWLEDLQIRRAGIFVQNNAKDAATMEAATHQFKLSNGQWRLIGLKIYLTDHRPYARSTKDTDMNLLMGSVIEKVQKRGKKPVLTNRRQKFAACFLKDFDFSNGFCAEESPQ